MAIEFRLVEFNERRWLRGADAARVAIHDTEQANDGVEEWLWMSKRNLAANIKEFGAHPELLKAVLEYTKRGAS